MQHDFSTPMYSVLPTNTLPTVQELETRENILICGDKCLSLQVYACLMRS